MPLERQSRLVSAAFLGILLLSVALKIYASQLLVWEVDYVPVVARGQAWLDGGSFPAVGTLSSVAAFNMPFLPWMQLPALLFTRDVRLVLVITQLAFNLLGTWVVFRLGARLFDRAAGMLAAILFTFSDIGISGAYTAWAQLQLPVFTILVAYFLYLWLKENRWWQVALVWISATAAFMTHFSAILFMASSLYFGCCCACRGIRGVWRWDSSFRRRCSRLTWPLKHDRTSSICKRFSANAAASAPKNWRNTPISSRRRKPAPRRRRQRQFKKRTRKCLAGNPRAWNGLSPGR